MFILIFHRTLRNMSDNPFEEGSTVGDFVCLT